MRKLLFLFLLLPQFLFATEEPQTVDTLATAEEEVDNTYLLDSINGSQGMVFLEEAHAYINVPEGYCYLSKEKANHLLSDYWGNPVSDFILGCLVTDSAKIYKDVEVAFMFFFEDCGHVKDEDASSYSYDEILKDLQKDVAERSEERVKQGYDACELVGWAAQPVYDSEKKILYWAKHLRFGNNGLEEASDTAYYDETLNYDIRILGREGILTLRAIADMEDLPVVDEMKSIIIENTHFNEGYTYADFNPATDHIAEWGIGALVAGKVLAKAGILAKCSAFLLKFWKPIAIALGALFTFLFKRKKRE